ncbi:MAG: PAS domain S-box protein [Mariprofundus sp.]|nr:PAS domain S-box protein [Mariprofundus sp.]
MVSKTVNIAYLVRYLLPLIAIVVSVEYGIMIVFEATGVGAQLSREMEALLDALLLLLLSAMPVYFWVIKPMFKLLRARHEELKNLEEALEGAGDAVMITDVSGAISYVNHAFTVITGFASEEIIGKNPRVLQSGKQSEAFYKMMWNTILTTGEWEGELWNKRKSGDIFPERLHIKSVKDSEGAIRYYIGIITDVTEQRLQEKRLQQSQKMEAVGTLVGGVAHNFNNLLAAISGKAYLAKLKSREPATIAYLDTVEEIVQDAAKIVSQLLSFSHVSSRSKKTCSIVELLDDAVKTARLGIAEDIELITAFTDESLKVYCDPTEIQQVFINLINNARDAVAGQEKRQIHVSIEKCVKHQCKRELDCCVCSQSVAKIVIEDTGAGILGHDLDYIFDPFFTTKPVGSGTGLGLSMAKGAIETHAGEINVGSDPGVGTRFEICLPLVSVASVDVNVDKELVALGHGETILLVDDEDVLRTTVTQLLEALNYHVLSAENGQQGLDVFRAHEHQIALVISDIIMPEMDGTVAVQAMRKLCAELPVIYITGYDREKERTSPLEDERSITLSKPFNVVDLSKHVHQLLHHKGV